MSDRNDRRRAQDHSYGRDHDYARSGSYPGSEVYTQDDYVHGGPVDRPGAGGGSGGSYGGSQGADVGQQGNRGFWPSARDEDAFERRGERRPLERHDFRPLLRHPGQSSREQGYSPADDSEPGPFRAVHEQRRPLEGSPGALGYPEYRRHDFPGGGGALARRVGGSGGEGQHRGRGPKGYSRSDDRIREDVSDRLMDDGVVDASDVEVQVSGGEATLMGEVGTRGERRRAEDIVYSVSGVRHVQNNLRVRNRQVTVGDKGDSLASLGDTVSTSALEDTSTGQKSTLGGDALAADPRTEEGSPPKR